MPRHGHAVTQIQAIWACLCLGTACMDAEAFAVYCRSHGLPIYGLIVLFTVRAAKQVWDILPPCRYAFSFSLRLSLLNIHYRRPASWQRAGGQVAIRLRRLVNLPALLGLCLDLPNRILFSFLVLICQ